MPITIQTASFYYNRVLIYILKVEKVRLHIVTAPLIISITVAALLLLALCNTARGSQLDRIENSQLRKFTRRELANGAPTLDITSRALYREALKLMDLDKNDIAREKLLLSSQLSGDYPDPLFTLARLEFTSAEPDFLFHLLKALSRSTGNFYSRCQLAANATLLLMGSLVITLAVVLFLLLWKYWSFINHWIKERYPRKNAFLPASWIAFIAVAALLMLRPGMIAYISLLTILLWTFMNGREKATVIVLMILLSIGSLFSRPANTFIAVMDPGSVTSKLSLINRRGAESRLIDAISSIQNPAFRAEKDYALGTLMYRQSRIEQAKKHFLNSVAERENFAPAFINLGNVYFEQEDYDKAIAGYQNAIALDSTNVIAHYNIGQAYIKKMLFSESSAALEKANNLGLDNFRDIYSATRMRNLTIYEGGLRERDLWSAAYRETMTADTDILDLVMRPYLLVSLRWLWLVFGATLILAIVIGRKVPSGWWVFRCNNCGNPTCPHCSVSEEGISLCPDCSGVIEGLTSIKVMEALLRHKRQKNIKRNDNKSLFLRIIRPAGAYLFSGRLLAGSVIIMINSAALLTLIWRGSYFINFRTVPVGTPAWKYLLPLAVMGLSYLAAASVKPRRPPANYRILPPDFRADMKKQKEERRNSIKTGNKPPEAVESFLDDF